MSLVYIGEPFPDHYLWSEYEKYILKVLKERIPRKYPKDRNMLINTTWFGPTFDNNCYNEALTYQGQVDNLFIVSTVDPMYISPPNFDEFYNQMGRPKLFKIGNYDDSEYEFNFFAPVLNNMFEKYSADDVVLKKIKYKFINYNRKPRFHRVWLVRSIVDAGLDHYGIQTLGKPDPTYDLDPDNTLFIPGEPIELYRKYGHWFKGEDPTGIPHDVLSLHNLDYWRHHFLYVVSATMFWPWDDIFVSETQFKPIIGLRPFIINGNPRTYKWLRDRGFCTFNHYFPFVDLEDTDENSIQASIIKVLEWICNTDDSELMQMYRDMLPNLMHNRSRFFEFADEQKNKVNRLLL